MEPDFDMVINSTFVSPTNLAANGPIYLAKEDNVLSEQTFRVVVQVIESVPPGANINPAMTSVDFSISGGQQISHVEFLPTMQRVNFVIILFHDNIPEKTEAFRVTSFADDNTEVGGEVIDLPHYIPPKILPADTYVIIEDDDRKIL